MPMRIRPSLPLLALSLLASGRADAQASPVFKIFLSEPGVYGVSYESLQKAGLAGEVASARLGLTNRGKPVPIWVEDGGDGSFGPGDRLEFVGDRLPGEVSYSNEYSNLNVYRLRLDAESPARMVSPAGGVPRGAAPIEISARQRFERDAILLRFPSAGDRPQELWFWAKLTQIDPAPFTQEVDLADLAQGSPRPIRLAVELRGWSQPARRAPQMKDHRAEISVDGRFVAAGEWDNLDGP
ncbi:MAG TPA: hypothetical protein VN783_11335, partial [Thermoanaerobaculia bacterium]|nr:hypothetical protein [Thermoanaerobaculia bacterium]